MNPVGVGTWIGDWIWGLPLIVLTVVIHVCGLALIGERVDSVISRMNRRSILKFARVMGTTALLATMLHGFEAFIWASAYRIVGALPDNRTGMLYSLSAMTTYGHANLFLQDRWQMMGALEALNGMLLFGLTTAFMFGMMQRSLAVK
jgi:hypothetical protein